MTVIFFKELYSFPANCCIIILLFLLLYLISFLPVIISANHDEILSQTLYFLLHFLFISIYRHTTTPVLQGFLLHLHCNFDLIFATKAVNIYLIQLPDTN